MSTAGETSQNVMGKFAIITTFVRRIVDCSISVILSTSSRRRGLFLSQGIAGTPWLFFNSFIRIHKVLQVQKPHNKFLLQNFDVLELINLAQTRPIIISPSSFHCDPNFPPSLRVYLTSQYSIGKRSGSHGTVSRLAGCARNTYFSIFHNVDATVTGI